MILTLTSPNEQNDHDYLGDKVIHGATSMRLTEWCSTVHTSGSLHSPFHLIVLGNFKIYFIPVKYALERISIWLRIAMIINKPLIDRAC